MTRYLEKLQRKDEELLPAKEHSLFRNTSVVLEKEKAREEFCDENFDEAMRYMNMYLKDLEKRKIVLKKKGEEEFLFLDYTTRFSESYKSEIKKKLKLMQQNWKKVRSCGHLVLTIENMSAGVLKKKKNEISEALHRFFIKLQRREGNVNRIVTREVTMNENDRKLHLHFHCLLINWRYRDDLEDIKKDWEEAGKSVSLKTKYARYGFIDNLHDAVGYVTKYITKDFKKLNLTSLTLSLLNLKSYTTNIKKTVEEVVRGANEKLYEFIGVILEGRVEEFMRRVWVWGDMMIILNEQRLRQRGLCLWT